MSDEQEPKSEFDAEPEAGAEATKESAGEFSSEFESEFDSEFEEEEAQETEEEDKELQGKDVGQREALIHEQITHEEKRKKRSITYNLEIIHKKLEPVIKIVSNILGKVKDFKITFKGITISTFKILQSLVVIGVIGATLNLFVGYVNYLSEVFDDTFITESLDDSALASAKEALNDAGIGLIDEDALQEIGEVFPIKNIILNIRHKNGDHDSLLKISLGLELENEDLLDELQNKKTQLKHLIIINLSHSYYSDMRNFRFRKALKAKIRNQINGFLKTGSIRRIFITQQIFD